MLENNHRSFLKSICPFVESQTRSWDEGLTMTSITSRSSSCRRSFLGAVLHLPGAASWWISICLYLSPLMTPLMLNRSPAHLLPVFCATLPIFPRIVEALDLDSMSAFWLQFFYEDHFWPAVSGLTLTVSTVAAAVLRNTRRRCCLFLSPLLLSWVRMSQTGEAGPSYVFIQNLASWLWSGLLLYSMSAVDAGGLLLLGLHQVVIFHPMSSSAGLPPAEVAVVVW